jgi:hypothetical protein
VVGFIALAKHARLLPALWNVAWNDDIADFDSGHALADALYYGGCLMAKDAWECTFTIVSVKSVYICVAECI